MSLDDPQITNALSAAGIPKKYQHKDQALRNYGASVAVQLADWIDNDAVLEIKAGKGRFFVGDSVRALDLFYYTARGLIIRRLAVWVLALPVIGKILWTDEFRERIAGVDVLCVQGFYDVHFKHPLSEEVLSSCDWFFRQRLLNEQAILFHATDTISACEWWSKTLLNLVSDSVGSPIIVGDAATVRSRARRIT